MSIRTWWLCIVLAADLLLAPAFAAAAQAEPAETWPASPAGAVTPDADAAESSEGFEAENAWERTQLALYDVLAADASPRMQVLVTRVWLPSPDETPAALRPKRKDVIARAVSFAPDDALVQWIAATDGQYEGNHCGETSWPDEEVANLLRLEPENAGAWRYAVALAHAKGDEAGVDDALSRMAAAPRAEDHLVEEIAAWTSVFRAHSELAGSPYTPYADYSFGASEKASLTAMGEIGPSAPGNELLQAVCTPDGGSERTWRRLGWCLDAGHVLAEKGTSFALRRSGLAMLKAAGDASEETSSAGRELDWLEANDANPMRHFFDDDPENLPASLGDWHGAKTEIAAIEHRLKRLGLPLSPPPGWTKPPRESDEEQDAAAKAEEKAFGDYLASLFADMRASGEAHTRVFAINSEPYAANVSSAVSGGVPVVDEAARTAAEAKRREAIESIATANAANTKVQWQVAFATDASAEAKTAAIATVQQAEGDNAAAWALSLEHAEAGDALVDTLLQRMAASPRYDLHAMDEVSTMIEFMRRRPIPPEALDHAWWKPSKRAVSAEEGAKYVAIVMTSSSVGVTAAIADTCARSTAPARRDACVAIGRLLVRKGPDLQSVRIGEGMLRRLKSLDDADASRARRVHWWYEVMERQERSGSVEAYLDDYIASGNQVDALKRNAARAGKTAPAANWNPRRWSY